MDIKQLTEMVKDLSTKRFYGTLQIEFRAGRPYLGLRTEKILFDQPSVQLLPRGQEQFKDEKLKYIG